MLYMFCGTMPRPDNSCRIPIALLPTQIQEQLASLLLMYFHLAWLVLCATDVLFDGGFLTYLVDKFIGSTGYDNWLYCACFQLLFILLILYLVESEVKVNVMIAISVGCTYVCKLVDWLV